MTARHRGLLRKEAERDQKKISVSSAELLWLLNTVDRFERHCDIAMARVRKANSTAIVGDVDRVKLELLAAITEDIADALGDGSE